VYKVCTWEDVKEEEPTQRERASEHEQGEGQREKELHINIENNFGLE